MLGDLTINGTTKPIELPVEFNASKHSSTNDTPDSTLKASSRVKSEMPEAARYPVDVD